MQEQNFRLHAQVVGWLHVIESVLYLSIACLSITFFIGIGIAADDPQAFHILSIVGFCAATFFLVLGVPTLVAGWGLLKGKTWSRVFAMVLAILGLFLFPIGTIVGVYVLWVMTADPAAAYFEQR